MEDITGALCHGYRSVHAHRGNAVDDIEQRVCDFENLDFLGASQFQVLGLLYFHTMPGP